MSLLSMSFPLLSVYSRLFSFLFNLTLYSECLLVPLFLVLFWSSDKYRSRETPVFRSLKEHLTSRTTEVRREVLVYKPISWSPHSSGILTRPKVCPLKIES